MPEPLPLPVVDDHCHLDIPAASRDETAEERSLDEALALAAAVGVPRAVQVGYDVASSRWSVEAANTHPALLAGVALHPNEAPRLAASGGLPAAYAQIEALAADDRVRVIGETGLDTFRTGPEGAAAQEESFRWHIDLAKRTGKVLQIHDRDAHADVLRILAEEGAPERTVLHCFSGDAEMARECVRRGYVLSVAGHGDLRQRQGSARGGGPRRRLSCSRSRPTRRTSPRPRTEGARTAATSCR